MTKLTRDERSDNEEEEGQETSPTEDEEDVQQLNPSNGLSSDTTHEKNGCFGSSPSQNDCLSKIMS